MAPWADGGEGSASGTAESAPASTAPGGARTGGPTIGHIGRYALKHILGSGGIGTVYAAHDPLLSRLIAVKTLHVEVADEQRQAFNTLFLEEARAAGGLSHPHIVTVYDAGISDQRAYIAMELLQGRDLRKLREEGWRASPAQAALIVRRVADALAHAHSKGVVHRDIKPANIFMVGQTQPRVLDFGIARVAREGRSHDQPSTHAGQIRAPLDATGSPRELAAGSPYYMAPEQVRQQPVDRRADVFSLGVLLYEMLADVKPFTGRTLAEIHQAVLHHEPPPADTVDPTVPAGLAQIAARAMEKDPERRYRSARALGADLRRWLEEDAAGLTPAATLPAAPTGRRGRGFRSRWQAATLPIALVVGLAVMATSLWRGPEPLGATPGVAAQTPARATGASPASPVAATATPARQIAGADAGGASSSGRGAAQGGGTEPAGADAVAGPTTQLPSEAMPPGTSTSTSPPTAAAAATATTAATAAPTTGPVSAASPGPVLAAAPAPPAATASTKAPPVRPVATVASAEAARQNKPRSGRETGEARDAVERHRAAAKAAPAAEGLVRIAVSPWGQIEVDGVAVGTAPPLHELSLREGPHRIVIRNAEFAPFTATVQVTPGQPIVLRHRFGP